MLTRRTFLGLSGGVVAAAIGDDLRPPALPPPAIPAGLNLDFSDDGFIAAACECIIPATESSPGAIAAGVPTALARQLRGPWGMGTSLHRTGPWQSGAPVPRGAVPGTPAEQFSVAVRNLDQRLGSRTAFARLSPEAQRRFLERLRDAPIDLGGVPSDLFLEGLLTLAVEAYFSHAAIGATRDRIEWPLPGFPGAHSLLAHETG